MSFVNSHFEKLKICVNKEAGREDSIVPTRLPESQYPLS